MAVEIACLPPRDRDRPERTSFEICAEEIGDCEDLSAGAAFTGKTHVAAPAVAVAASSSHQADSSR